MKKLLLFLLLIPALLKAQEYKQMGNALQRQSNGSYNNYRFALGSPGFMYLYTKAQIDSINALNATAFTKQFKNVGTTIAPIIALNAPGIGVTGGLVRLLNDTTLILDTAYHLRYGQGIPSMTGHSGQYLTNNGTAANWGTVSGGVAWGAITGTLSSQTDLQNALNLKSNLASPIFTGVPTAPTATVGTNTTQLATTAFVLANAGSTSPGGSNKQVQYNNSGAFAGNSNLIFDQSTSSTYVGNVPVAPALTGNTQNIGDSFVVGTGASPSSQRFTTQLAVALGLTEINGGIGGTDLGAGGGSAWVDNLTNIPTKGASDRYLVICLGQNDINTATNTYFEHQFAADWVTVLNYAHSTGGWAYNQIILTNVAFNPGPPPGSLTSAQYLSRQKQFSFAVDSIAAVFGCIDVNINGLIKNDGGYSLLSDGQHPNNLGYTLIAKLCYNAIYPNVAQNGETLGVGGLSQLTYLNLPKIPNLPNNATNVLLGITVGDTVGRVVQLPPGIQTGGSMYLNGTVYQPGWITPSGFTVQSNDILMSQAGRVAGIFTSNTSFNIYNYLQPVDNGGGMDLVTNGSVQGAINMMPGGGSPTAAFFANGTTGIYGDVKNTSLDNKFFVDNGGGYTAGYYPLRNTGATSLFNTYSLGYINFLVSNRTNGGSLEAARFTPLGHLIAGTITDNGYNVDIFGNGRFTTGAQFGVLLASNITVVTPSTSGGTLPAGSHVYIVVPVDGNGGLGPLSNETGVTNTGSTSSNAVSYSAVTGAASYRIYTGTASLGENKYFTSVTTSATDIGSGYTTSALPTQNTSSLAGFNSSGNLSGVLPAYTSGTNLPVVYNSTNNRFETGASGGGGSVTSISGIATNGFTWSIANPTTTPAITLTLQNATTSQSGQLTSTDWNTFNGKQAALTFSTGLTNTANTITVSTSQNIATLSNLTTNGYVKTTGGGGALSVSTTVPTTDLTGALSAAQFPALTGDITTIAGALATTLKNTGIAGTYGQVTTDAQGRVTSGTANANLTATDATLTFSGTYTGAVARTIGLNLTNANTWTAIQTHQINALGTSPTDALIINNATAAAVGAQQYTPYLHFQSNGWGTTAGTSQSTDWFIYNTPVQSTVPTANLMFNFSVAGGGNTNQAKLSSAGVFTANSLQSLAAVQSLRSFSGTTSTDGLITNNSFVTTNTLTGSYSPRLNFLNAAWNTMATAANNIMSIIMETRGVTGSTPTNALYWASQNTTLGGGNVDIMSLTNLGNLTVTGTTGNQFTSAYDGSHTFTVAVASSGSTTLSTLAGGITLNPNNGLVALASSASLGCNNLIQTASGNNAKIVFATTGTTVSRNVNDANPAVIVNNLQGTGDEQDWQFNSVKVASVSAAGLGNFTGGVSVNGSSSGVISILPQAAAGTYNFNLPITAGTAGQALISQAGSSTAMTWGTVSTTQSSADLTAQSAAGNVTTFTVGASTATFNVSTYINVTAVSVDVIQGQITYTDENNTSQTVSLANISAIGNSTYSPITIRAKNATIITVKTNLTTGAGSITFDTGARITSL